MELSTPPHLIPEASLRAAPPEQLDALLKQIIGGWFMLTDGQGAVSKWSEPAELLFGKRTEDAVGHSFFETLVAGPLSPDAEQWRRFLSAGDPPSAPALVGLEARHAPTGGTFPLEVVFIPVKLDEGFDFSLLLEDLAFELPINLMLLRMRQQHPVVVRALSSALSAEPQPWENWRTAGTLVAFRPLAPTPWVQEEIERRAAQRALQDAEREAALSNTDPGVHGDTLDELDDAAAVVARLLSALERIDELERVAGRLPADMQEVRRDVQADSGELRRDGEQLRARLDALRVVADRLHEDAQAGAQALRVELDGVRASEAEARGAVEELRGELASLREAGAGRTDLDAIHARLGALADGAAAKEELDGLRRELDGLKQARAHADERMDGLAAEVRLALAAIEEMNAGLASAGQTAQVARLEAEAAKRAAEHAGEDTGEQVNQVFREILGLAAKGRPRPVAEPVPETEPHARELIPGFDDDGTAMAFLALDGRFRELNPSFCRLVGYQEHEFAKAAWPSPHDRHHYAEQLEQLSELVSGRVERLAVQSTYMHGQGLMVPVIGEISVEKGEDGAPSRLLLRAEERERTG